MIIPKRWLFCGAVLAFIMFICALPALSDQRVLEAKRYFSGQKMLVSYRQGGAVYGIYFFMEIHYCSTGSYFLFGQSRKQTVMGNEQMGGPIFSGRCFTTYIQ